MEQTLLVLALALLLEALLGYPQVLFRWAGHPVTWMGRLISVLDARLNSETASAQTRRAAGLLALIVLLAITAAAALLITIALHALAAGAAALLLALLAASLLAQRSLHQHVAAVSRRLRRDGLEGGRVAVANIVGRNPQSLDEPAICRAAIESLAENFSDGVVAPAFWIGLGELTGGAVYKAVNTADSMVGHRTPRYEAFGWAAARLDDLVNLPASRLSAVLIVAAAALQADASAAGALRAVARDARRHRSPNAGWPEAAVAGALGLRLAGPRTYGSTRVDDAWMGDGRAEARVEDIDRALALYRKACLLLWILALAFTWIATG